MGIKYVENLVAERDTMANQIMGLADRAAKESRSLTEAETTSIKSWRDRVTVLDSEIRSWNQDLDAFSKFQNLSEKGTEQREATRKQETTSKSLGQLFIESPEYRAYGMHGQSGIASIEERAALVTGADPGKAFMTPYRGYSLPLPAYQTPILSVIGQVSVSSNVVEYVTYPAAAPLAAVVAEGTAKPEATLTASLVSKTLETIAHHALVSRQAVEDSSELRSWIDGNLTRGVGDKLEALAAAAIIAATLPSTPTTGTDLLGAIRVAAGKVQSAGYSPNAVLLNPDDYAKIDVQIMGTANMAPTGVGSIWGMRIVPAAAVVAGTAYVGNFTDGVTLFSRNTTQVYVTDSHASLFLSNIFAILAERRALTAVTRPEALCKVTATATREK